MNDRTSNPIFQKLLSTAIYTWILGTSGPIIVALFFTQWESSSQAVIWGFGFTWWAFFGGAISLLVQAIIMRKSPLLALGAYLLPMLLLILVAGACLAVYPEMSFREEILSYSPSLLAFYVFGLVWVRLRSNHPGSHLRAMLPPVFGGIIMLSFVAFPVFTSNACRYRNAFALEVVSRADFGSLTEIQAVLEIRKPGSYQFSVPAFPEIYSEGDWAADFQQPKGEIIWGARGEPVDGESGSYPLKIRLTNFIATPDNAPMPNFGNPVVVEVRETQNPGELAAMVSAPGGGN